MVENFECPEISAVECAHALLDDIETANQTSLADLATISYVRLALLICPGVKTIMPAPDQIFYELTDDAAWQISVASIGNIEAFDMLVEICHSNVMNGKEIPKPMRANAAQLISGKWKGPQKKVRARGRTLVCFLYPIEFAFISAMPIKFQRLGAMVLMRQARLTL